MYKFVFLSLYISTQLVFAAEEVGVRSIPLAPPLDNADAEISGLTWCADKLILLPQYPSRLSSSAQSFFYYLHKKQIVDFLDGHNQSPLRPKKILVDPTALKKTVTFFDGFEGITCNQSKIWLSIEAISLFGSYQSFVVPGRINFDGTASITIDDSRITKLKSQSNLRNMGEEAIFVQDDNVIALHEINDSRMVRKPKAWRVDAKNSSLSALLFPNLPFRITDATALDSKNRFWVINYKYSGDMFSRHAKDDIASLYGQSESHKKYTNVERLVEFQLSVDGIERIERAPIQLKMNSAEGRNWEGLVRLNKRGFLLVTDKHPKTLLAFVPNKQ